MERTSFLHLCDNAEAGREDVFVQHPDAGEGGMVEGCDRDELIVLTSDGRKRHWDYRQCEETLSRRRIFPYR